eukprot:2458677-Pyramimonas_sp.AAC.1
MQTVCCAACCEQFKAEQGPAHKLTRSVRGVQQVARQLAGAAGLAETHVYGSSLSCRILTPPPS